MGKIQFSHECLKWKKGMPQPKIIVSKKRKEFGKMICSLCGEPARGKVIFDGTEKINIGGEGNSSQA